MTPNPWDLVFVLAGVTASASYRIARAEFPQVVGWKLAAVVFVRTIGVLGFAYCASLIVTSF